jgi:hypothetical protein
VTPMAADTDLIGYRDAWYEICGLLDLPAMAMSPKKVHETIVMPRLRNLIDALVKIRDEQDASTFSRVVAAQALKAAGARNHAADAGHTTATVTVAISRSRPMTDHDSAKLACPKCGYSMTPEFVSDDDAVAEHTDSAKHRYFRVAAAGGDSNTLYVKDDTRMGDVFDVVGSQPVVIEPHAMTDVEFEALGEFDGF